MAFGQQSGPPASHKQLQYLEALLRKAGHDGFRDARGPLGLTQRQAGGKFTKDEASTLIDQLLAEDPEVEAPIGGRPADAGADARPPTASRRSGCRRSRACRPRSWPTSSSAAAGLVQAPLRALRTRYSSRALRSPGTSTACCWRASSGTISRAPLVGGGQHHRRRAAVLVGPQPVDRGDAPAVARHEPREVVLRHRRAEVVADRALVLEELGRDDGADRVAAEVLGTGGAAAVPVEAGHRVGAARLELAAEHVAVRHDVESRVCELRG